MVDMPDEIEWLPVGDFNRMHTPSDRNKAGGSVQNMLDFNAVISNLRLEEFELLGNNLLGAICNPHPFRNV
jgi:hypothetical protein